LKATRSIGWIGAWAAVALAAPAARAEFDLVFSIPNPASFTANQLSILNEALGRVEGMWETAITGYQPGISIASLPISINATNSGLAAASYSGSVNEGGFWLPTSGYIQINVNEIENFANWQGVPGPPTYKPPTNLNYIDELLAHETGHVLGIGTLWYSNGVYDNNFHYTGQYGLAAYQAEFDAAATFVPVENAGLAGTPGAHWDQRMRSSPQEGNPSDPWSLDPRVFVKDQYGRDRGLELMTGAIDPDWGEPYLSRFTVESMRDMGYTVAAFEDFNSDGTVDLADFDVLLANFGRTELQVDSFRFGDADRDRDVDLQDFRLWKDVSTVVPEPSALALAALGLLLGCRTIRRRSARCS
jgi:hypothetical protein